MLPLSLAVLAAMGSAAVFANEETVYLDPVQVKASLEAETILEHAERTGAREVRDIFAGEADVSIGGGDRQGRRLHLRGVEGSNLNITVDGARQGANLYNHRGGMLGVDPAILKRVDVNAGPATAEAGAAALGGSIRFVTQDAQDLATEGQIASGFVKAGHASAASAQTLNAALALTPVEHWGLLVYTGGSDADLQRIGGGDKVPFSAYDDRNHLIKLSHIGDVHELRIGHEQNKTVGLNFQQRGDYPYQVQPPIDNRPPRQQTLKRDSTHLDYRWHTQSPWLAPEINLYQQKTAWSSPDNNGEAFDSKGSGGTLKNTLSLSPGVRLVAGVDYLQEQGNAYGNNLPVSEGAVDYKNTGLFAQVYWQWQSLALTSGVRRDAYRTEYGDGHASGDAWSPNLQGEWQLNDQWQVFAGYGSSIRGFGTIPVHFARNIQPNAVAPEKEERAKQQEAGVRLTQFRVGDIQYSAEASYFNNAIHDFILYHHGGSGGLGGRPVIGFSNQDVPVTFEGAQLKLLAQTGSSFAELTYNHTSTRNLPDQPQHSVRAGTQLGDKWILNLGHGFSDRLSAGYQLTRQDSLALEGGVAKAGYLVHDLHLSWQPLVVPGLELVLAAQNLTDRQYISHSTLTQNGFATEEPGRDLRVSVRYSF